jgi:hypothetical protein
VKHAGAQDPGDKFDEIFAGSASRVEEAGGTPLQNDTARSEDETPEDTHGTDA